jgi:hypothetical protein
MRVKALAFALMLAPLGCTSMRRVEPEHFIPNHNLDLVSVWTTRDDVTIVSYPQVRGDTLSGLVFAEPWAMPLKDVVKVEARASDPMRTALFLVGAAASVVGMYLVTHGGRADGVIPCDLGLPPDLRAQTCGPSQ